MQPLPDVDTDTEPWWAATRDRRLLIQHCQACGRYQHYPRSLCTNCASTSLEFLPAAGLGHIYSFTHIYRAPSSDIPVPYVVALVKLQEGPVLLTHIVDYELDDVRCDMPVQVDWRPMSDGRHLPVFKPAGR